MIWWHHLVEIKRIKELALSTLLPPHHRPLPRIATSIRRNHGSSIVSMRVLQLLQHNRGKSGHRGFRTSCLVLTHFGHWPLVTKGTAPQPQSDILLSAGSGPHDGGKP